MSWRFRKSITILPGVRINIGKKGITSASVGKGWFSTNVSKKGISHNVNIPNTGLSYRTKKASYGSSFFNSNNDATFSFIAVIAFILILVFLGILIINNLLFPVGIDTNDALHSQNITNAKLQIYQTNDVAELDRIAFLLKNVPRSSKHWNEAQEMLLVINKKRPTPTPIPQPLKITELPPKASNRKYSIKPSPTPYSTPSTFDYSTDYPSGGSVSVRGYYRKNGTYVRPYTRRR